MLIRNELHAVMVQISSFEHLNVQKCFSFEGGGEQIAVTAKQFYIFLAVLVFVCVCEVSHQADTF